MSIFFACNSGSQPYLNILLLIMRLINQILILKKKTAINKNHAWWFKREISNDNIIINREKWNGIKSKIWKYFHQHFLGWVSWTIRYAPGIILALFMSDIRYSDIQTNNLWILARRIGRKSRTEQSYLFKDFHLRHLSTTEKSDNIFK